MSKYIIYEWDINHLNHDFSNTKVDNIGMRKCEKCGVFVYHSSHYNRYNTFNPNAINGDKTYPTLILSCEEMQIKKLLE
jgi:hypothetical protein